MARRDLFTAEFSAVARRQLRPGALGKFVRRQESAYGALPCTGEPVCIAGVIRGSRPTETPTSMGKIVRCRECGKVYRELDELEDLRDNDSVCLVCNNTIEVADWDRVLASYEDDDGDVEEDDDWEEDDDEEEAEEAEGEDLGDEDFDDVDEEEDDDDDDDDEDEDEDEDEEPAEEE
jgi:hypothetical protein